MSCMDIFSCFFNLLKLDSCPIATIYFNLVKMIRLNILLNVSFWCSLYRKSHRFGRTRVWVNDASVFHFEWTLAFIKTVTSLMPSMFLTLSIFTWQSLLQRFFFYTPHIIMVVLDISFFVIIITVTINFVLFYYSYVVVVFLGRGKGCSSFSRLTFSFRHLLPCV